MVALRTGKPCVDVVMGLYKPDGELVWLLLNSQPLFQEGTAPYAVTTTFYDITTTRSTQVNSHLELGEDCFNQDFVRINDVEQLSHRTMQLEEANLRLENEIRDRQRVEMALIASEEKARRQLAEIESIYATAPIGLCFVDTDLRYVRINEYLAEINGISALDHIGKTVREILPELGDAQEQLFEQVIQSGIPILNAEVHGTTPARPGVERDWLVSYHPLKETDGTILGINITVQEITERKRTEAALRESELIYRNLADTMPQMFWITRADGYHEYYNQRWYEYTGTTLEQTQGSGWQHLLHPDDVQRCSEVWNESLRTGKDYDIEYRFKRASDGQYRWHIGRAFPLRDRDGKILKWFGSCTDIHDQKCADEERVQMLERERAARSQAESANRIKDEFLAVVSHELRSPLNPILGWSKLLKSRKFDETTLARALDAIERNAKLQAQLIEDLLDVSRILRGKLNLNIAPINLAATIQAALETVRSSAEAKSIQIQTHLDVNVGQIMGDFNRLQQVGGNLLSNAVKFTPSGGRVEVFLEQVGSQAQITVSDTGKGISPDFLPHIFERFRQADSSTTRSFGGLGLGLAIVRQLVELQGGTVVAESPGEGQGAKFIVRLPLATTAQKPSFNRDQSQAELPELKILVVDDDADTREIVSLILEGYGAIVTVAASAAEALSILAASQPDLILSDLGMPEFDGYSLIRCIRKMPPEQGGQIPAIALTAYAREEDRDSALAAGFQDYITKPVDPAKLVKMISRYAQGSN